MQLEMELAMFIETMVVVFGWVKSVMTVFLEPPAIYFVGFAIVCAAAGAARKFVPMKRK